MTALPEDLVIHDGRQSPTAAVVQRGLCRYLRDLGFAVLPEFSLASGRRADVFAVNQQGLIWIAEIKSSPADFLSDNKWPDYWDYCDQLFFAIPEDMPPEMLPDETGLIVADAWSAEILRQPEPRKLAAARRKAVTLRFGLAAASRLQTLHDPGVTVP